MKKVLYVVVVLISFTVIATCQQVKVKVLDATTELPVKNAEVRFSFKGGNPFTPSYGRTIKMTDDNGEAEYRFPFKAQFEGVNVIKEGFYRGLSSKDKSGNNENLVKLRRVKNPIKGQAVLIAHAEGEGVGFGFQFPNETVEFKFDMIVNDWLPPLGKGKKADLVVTRLLNYKDNKNYEASIEVEFPGDYNGVFFLDGEKLMRSEFPYPYLAPKVPYTKKIVKSIVVTPSNFGSLTSIINDEAKSGDSYFFRIRSDGVNGELKDANYGIISLVQVQVFHGEIYMILKARLNSEDRTRNIEMTKKK